MNIIKKTSIFLPTRLILFWKIRSMGNSKWFLFVPFISWKEKRNNEKMLFQKKFRFAWVNHFYYTQNVHKDKKEKKKKRNSLIKIQQKNYYFSGCSDTNNYSPNDLIITDSLVNNSKHCYTWTYEYLPLFTSVPLNHSMSLWVLWSTEPSFRRMGRL